MVDPRWVPTGHHYDLHIEHDARDGIGPFESGAGWKVVWHTTEGRDFRSMQAVLKSKRAEPHFLIGQDGGERFRLVQFIPLDQGAKALEHPAGTAETNRARAIQVEICGFARNSQWWGPDVVNALAQLTRLIEHRVPVPRKAPRPFKVPALRYSQQGFVRARGHVGHEHVASQPSGHWDPGALPIQKVFRQIKKLEG